MHQPESGREGCWLGRCRRGDYDEEQFAYLHRRVTCKPSPPVLSSSCTAQTIAPFSLGFGLPRPSLLFPFSPSVALPVTPIIKRRSSDARPTGLVQSRSDGCGVIVRNRSSNRRSSAYASWATDLEKPRSRSWHALDTPGETLHPSCSSSSSPGVPGSTASAVDMEEHGQRLLRERSEMLEAARRREAELKRQQDEKNSWQVAALAERRREAAERRKTESEQRRREVEAQRRRQELEECSRRERRAAVLAQRLSEEGRPACASHLHGDILRLVLSSLDPYALLLSAMGVCELWHGAAKHNALWLPLCRHRWAMKAPRFHLTPEREATLISHPYGPASWFSAYREAEEDGAREFIFRDELTQLRFKFRWRRRLEEDASSGFIFEEDNFTIGHPFNTRFPWVLDDLGVGIQWGPADSMYPKGFVLKLADWSWRIENINAVLTEANSSEHTSLLPWPLLDNLREVDQNIGGIPH